MFQMIIIPEQVLYTTAVRKNPVLETTKVYKRNIIASARISRQWWIVQSNTYLQIPNRTAAFLKKQKVFSEQFVRVLSFGVLSARFGLKTPMRRGMRDDRIIDFGTQILVRSAFTS